MPLIKSDNLFLENTHMYVSDRVIHNSERMERFLIKRTHIKSLHCKRCSLYCNNNINYKMSLEKIETDSPFPCLGKLLRFIESSIKCLVAQQSTPH